MTQRHPIQNEEMMFITINTKNRHFHFLNGAIAREAIETLYRVKELHPFFLYGFVIMPDHLHLLLQIPAPLRVSKIIGEFKFGTTYNTGVSGLWQTRFHLRLPYNAVAALRYIHLNPVKAGLVELPEEYPWSSASGRWDVSSLEW